MSLNPPQSGLPIADAAKHLGVTVEMLRKRAQRGTLPAYKVEGRWFILVSEPDDPTPVQDTADVQDGQDRTSIPGQDAFRTMQGAIAPAAFSQLEAIRDQWLRPFVDELNAKSERIGRLEERLAATEQERDELQRRIAKQASESPQSAEDAPHATIATSPNDEPNGASSEPPKSGFSRWWAWISGR